MIDMSSFIGRREVLRDYSDGGRMERLAALLDHESPPWKTGILPPLGHWLCFSPNQRQSLIGADGHPVRTDDGLFPNVDLPRRMWAGSRVQFLEEIPLDAPIERTSTLISATPKSGRTGNMLFVTVRHEIARKGGPVAILEEQDIVYREAADKSGPFARAGGAPGELETIARSVTPDPIMLFRYSALTFNAHRIHYDRDYACSVEGYPDLVVQGPLIATLMLDHLLRKQNGRILAYSFRAAAPAFINEPLRLGLEWEGDSVKMRAIGPCGLTATGTAEIAA